MATRKNVCIQYPTGGTIKKGKDTYPETRLLTVGSAFQDEESGRINGQFRAMPRTGTGNSSSSTPCPAKKTANSVSSFRSAQSPSFTGAF